MRKDKLHNLLRYIYRSIINTRNVFLGYLFRIIPIDNNKVVITNFWGRGYTDNPKYVADYLLKNYKDVKIVWLVKNENEKKLMPEEIKIVKYGSVSSLLEYATSKVWVDNSRKEWYIKKRKNQYYIQLWHGSIGLKKIERDAIDTLDPIYKKIAINDSKMIDYAISNSTHCTKMFKEHFWYDGEVLEFGNPRNDIFFSTNKEELKKEYYKKYNLPEDARIILYTPTFRKDKQFNYFSFDIEKLLKMMDGNYYFFSKLHPNVCIKEISNNPKIINIPSYEDVDKLLFIADIIISDYSSIIFDYLFMNDAIYLYAPDYEEYIKERGFYFDYKKLPFSISYDGNSLINNIVNGEYKKYKEELDKFLKELNIIDNGTASEKVCNLIYELINRR